MILKPGKNWVLLFFIVTLFQSGLLKAQIDFGMGSEYHYLKGSQAATLSSNWYTDSFNDAWAVGPSPFWYGDGSGGTLLSDMQNSYSTVYLRSTFSVTNANLVSNLNISVDYDDGFILWINGQNILSINAPDDPQYDSFSTDLHESGDPVLFQVDADDANLTEGENLIAVQVFNTSLTSSDIHFNASITADVEMQTYPDTLAFSFSKRAGYYESPFYLTLNFENQDAELYYTLDGSYPGESPTSFR